ncbi:MAG: 3-methyl-2-oxobutanoate hydroxymethyltransferase [Limibacillus sp.]|jgi:3-methyl-2-oxobutanoate hydroxymethyltransferase
MTAAKQLRVPDIRARKGGPLVCLTAYSASIAALADEAADLVLVGDSLGNVLYGWDTTLPVTLDMMIAHGEVVARICRRALVVVDLPFGSYQESRAQAFASAARVLKETGAAAVKLEGGKEMAETVAFLTGRGVPVLGHVGLMPQQVHARGGFKRESDVEKVIADAKAIQEAGAFALVLEGVTPEVAKAVTEKTAVPTIGIAAGESCDGEIRVTEDLLGLNPSPPPFAETDKALRPAMQACLAAFAKKARREG